jgi:gentisate 1,2-dioxygenase
MIVPIEPIPTAPHRMSVTTTETTYMDATADSADRLISELDGTHTLPLWAQMAKLNPAAPNPRCTPHIWRYDAMRPYLLRAGDLITEKQAERRVLMLVNPTRGMPIFAVQLR